MAIGPAIELYSLGQDIRGRCRCFRLARENLLQLHPCSHLHGRHGRRASLGLQEGVKMTKFRSLDLSKSREQRPHQISLQMVPTRLDPPLMRVKKACQRTRWTEIYFYEPARKWQLTFGTGFTLSGRIFDRRLLVMTKLLKCSSLVDKARIKLSDQRRNRGAKRRYGLAHVVQALQASLLLIRNGRLQHGQNIPSQPPCHLDLDRHWQTHRSGAIMA